jgi:hypothetical protein
VPQQNQSTNDDDEQTLARALDESVQFEKVRSRKDKRKQQLDKLPAAVNGDNTVKVMHLNSHENCFIFS